MSNIISIVWFQQDLRLRDNPALFHAAKKGQVLPLYVLDDTRTSFLGSTSKWWLYHSLSSLDKSLGNKLSILRGKAEDVIPNLCDKYHIKNIFWNRCYEPWQIEREKNLSLILEAKQITVHNYNGLLISEPWEILKNDGSPYKVFTPYYKQFVIQFLKDSKNTFPPPVKLNLKKLKSSQPINALKLLPKNNWYKKFENHWFIGEKAAQENLNTFIKKGLNRYQKERDYPPLDAVSKLSPHIHFGEISPRQTFLATMESKSDENRETFHKELGWREFSYYLLYHYPQISNQNLNTKFNHFPWTQSPNYFNRWKNGLTGYPFVDAGMRELWETGYMHNRVRMVVASFLVKNLMIHWRYGANWFYDCLLDADLASNCTNWQWVAGSGTDSSPYFRIFNPITQGEKFDPSGEYTRNFVPELRNIPQRFLFKPWTAPSDILKESGIELGVNYPKPIVDLKESRQKALDSYYKI